MEEALTSSGYPATSPWWLETLTRFYQSGKRQLVIRAGRRAGKSSTLCRIAVLEALYGDHQIPPGDVGMVGVVSVNREEATSRITTIKSILDTLGVRYETSGKDTIDLIGRRIRFRVFTGSVKGVVGGTWICAICDEVSRWRDDDAGANPAKEVLASLRPTLATQPNAKLFLSSSPLATQDAHATAYAEGDTPFQMTAWAPTWIANPSLTEADTRGLEPDEHIHSREYGALPSDSESPVFTGAAFDSLLIDNLYGLDPLGDRPIGLFDSSMGRLDAATWGMARWLRPHHPEEPAHLWMSLTANRGLVRTDHLTASDQVTIGQAVPAVDANNRLVPNPKAGYQPAPRLAVWGMGALTGRFSETVSFPQMVATAVQTFKRHGVHDVLGDSYMSYALQPEFRKHGMRYVEQVWSNESKSRAVLRLRQLVRDKTLAIANEGKETEELKKEILSFREKILASGVLSYGARSGAHDDRVALLINLAMADTDELLKGSPIGRVRHRNVQTYA